MKTITLTQGQFALVDEEDFEELNQYNWCAWARKSPQGHVLTYYAIRTVYSNNTKAVVRMHRVVANTPPGLDTDHINGDGLDNRRCNLRVVTRTQNGRNRTNKAASRRSSFRGVSWHKQHRKWYASMSAGRVQKFLGLFASEHAAAQAYDDAGFVRDPQHFTPNFPPLTIKIDRT